MGVPCANVLFSLHPRDTAHPQGFADGTLSWPDKKRLGIEFAVCEGITATGLPVAGATAPGGEKAAYEAARRYMRAHYPWARQAVAHRTYPVGDRAELGWTTQWTWEHDGVVMPRALDVQVDRQGRVSRLDVTLGPTRLDLEPGKLSAVEAERIVRARLAAQSGGRGVPDELRFDAFALKAVERDGEWRAEWLVHESVGAVRCGAVRCGAVRCGAVRCGAVRCGAVRCGAARDGAAPPAPGSADILWVDAVSGDVHVSAFGRG
ncbi:hypothetical protein ACFY8F_00475 [Streptomyces tanashiensis]|uniref:hypothetical protein n=1 Tax=Streptomyces tanashiensis TaxID=67367 RepID=UPI0036C62E32